MPRRKLNPTPRRRQRTLEPIVPRDAEDTDRSGARARGNAWQPTFSSQLDVGVGNELAEQTPTLILSSLGNVDTALEGWDNVVTNANTSGQSHNTLTTWGESQSQVLSVGLDTVGPPAHTIHSTVLPIRQTLPAPSLVPPLGRQRRRSNEVPMTVYPVSAKSADGEFEPALAILNRRTSRSAISKKFLQVIGIRARPIPPGNYLRSPAHTPAGVVQPTEYAEVEIRSIRYNIFTIKLNLVVIDDNSLTERVDLFLGRGVLERVRERNQRLRVADSPLFASHVQMNGRGTDSLRPSPSPSQSLYSWGASTEFGSMPQPVLSMVPSAFVGPPSSQAGQQFVHSNDLFSISPQHLGGALAVSTPSGATSSGESVLSYAALSSFNHSEHVEPNESIFNAWPVTTSSYTTSDEPPPQYGITNVPTITIHDIHEDWEYQGGTLIIPEGNV